jgi:hypothetical protein
MIKVEGSPVKRIGENLLLFRGKRQNRNQPIMLAL